MRKLATLFIFVMIAALNVFAASAAVVDIKSAAMDKVTIYYLIEPGDENDTYSELAEKIYGDDELWTVIWEKNLIPVDEIKHGEVLKIPASGLSVESVRSRLAARGLPVRIFERDSDKQILHALLSLKRSVREAGKTTGEEIQQTRERISALQDGLLETKSTLSNIEKQIGQDSPQDINIDIDADRDMGREAEPIFSEHRAFGWGFVAAMFVLSAILGAGWFGFHRCSSARKKERPPSRIAGASVEVPANGESYYVYQPETKPVGEKVFYRTFNPAATDGSWVESLEELRISAEQSLKKYESNKLKAGEEKDNIQQAFDSGRLIRHKRKSSF